MNKLSRVSWIAGMAILSVSFAAAQQDLATGAVQGVTSVKGGTIDTTTAIFSNCGNGCGQINSKSGYYVSGTGISPGTGQTLAMGFSVKAAQQFSRALTPNSVYTTNGGSSSGTMSAYLLNGTKAGGPTTLFATLNQFGTIPDFPSIKVLSYTSTAPVTFKTGGTYFLCETESVSNVQLLWMLSLKDFTSPFWFQTSDSCTAGGIVWSNTTGAVAGGAFEID